jgi:hypothetical protein
MAVLRERTEATALFARIPVVEQIDRGFNDCCYEHLVLADAGSTKIERNDYYGLYFQKQTSIDTCDFVLVKVSDLSEYALNDGTYGEFYDFGSFPDSPDMTQYIVDWKKVLLAHGQGQYRLRRDVTVSGVSVQLSTYTFNLKQYSVENADHTFRFDIVMNGVLEREGLNFKNTNFRHSLRSRGFFGNNNPEWIEDKVVYRTKASNTPTFMNKKDVYVLQTELLPSCITKEIVNFMMFAGDKWFSDYNANNHDYELTRVAVVFDGNQGHDYWATSRDARLNYTFSERYLNNNKRNC